MTPVEKALFAHHDAIASARSGEILMVCEPIVAHMIFASRMVDLPIGSSLRVRHHTGILWCDAAIDGKVQTVVINKEYFSCLERSGERKVKVR